MSQWNKLFPVQLLEAGGLFIISLFLFVYKKRTVAFFLVIYSSIRFFVDFLRNRDVKKLIGPMSDIQWLCLFVVFMMFILYMTRRKIRERSV